MKLTIGAAPGHLPTTIQRKPSGWMLSGGTAGAGSTELRLKTGEVVERLVVSQQDKRMLVVEDLTAAGLTELIPAATGKSTSAIKTRILALLS